MSVDGDVPVADVATAPSISATGAVVAFEATAADSGTRVWVRDRNASTTRAVAEVTSGSPGISGNGCIVAYVVPVEAVSQLVAVDRCAASAEGPLPLGTVVDSIEGPVPSAPAVAFDGTTIGWSTGTEVRRYTRPPGGATWALTHAFDAEPVADEATVTGSRIDISASGTAVAFTAGPGTAPYAPTPPNVYVWELDAGNSTVEAMSVTTAGTIGTGASSSPSISGDGATVVFDTTSDDLAVLGGVVATTPLVVAVDRESRASGVVVDDASRPSVSADGNHIVYERGTAIRVASSTDGWVTSTDRIIDELASAAPVTPATLTQFGRWIAFDSSSLPPTDMTQVHLADLRSSDTTNTDTTTTTTTTTTDNTTSTTVDSTTSIPPATTTPAPTTTTDSPTVATTTPATPVPTAGPYTGVSVFTGAFPRVVLPRTTFRPTSTSPGSSFGGFLPPLEAGPVATAVVFEPTVVDAGRRTQTVTLSTFSSIDVVSVVAEPPGPFAVTQDGCSGRVETSCAVEVQFAPTAIGPVTGSVAFRLADGSVVAARLDGTGSPQPTLDVVPGVGGAGQTVTLFGAGFPDGATIQLRRGTDPVADQVVVDADGTFAHVIVVLPNSPTGPMALTVDGEPDVFDATTTELLVSTRGAGSNDAALRGGASSLAGR